MWNTVKCWDLLLCLDCCSLASISHIAFISLLFRSNFIYNSDVYKRLGQFDYTKQHLRTDHIHTCFEKDIWIYIGEVKEGTDHIPHGIGIQVWRNGFTQQLNNNDSWWDGN